MLTLGILASKELVCVTTSTPSTQAEERVAGDHSKRQVEKSCVMDLVLSARQCWRRAEPLSGRAHGNGWLLHSKFFSRDSQHWLRCTARCHDWWREPLPCTTPRDTTRLVCFTRTSCFLGHSSSDAQCLVYCTPQPALVRAASCCQPTLMMVTIKLSRGNHWTSRGDSDWTFKNTWIIDRAWSGLLLAACAQHDIHRRSTAEVGRIPRPFDNDFSERMRNELIRIQMEHRRQLLLLAWKIPFELVLSSPSKFRAQNVQCHSARNTVSSVSVSCVLQDLCFALCVHALLLREAYGRSRCVCIIIKVCTLWSSTVDMNFRACPSRVAVPCNGYSTPHSHSRGRSQFVCRLSLRHVFFEDLAVLQTVISRQHNRSHRAACQ